MMMPYPPFKMMIMKMMISMTISSLLLLLLLQTQQWAGPIPSRIKALVPSMSAPGMMTWPLSLRKHRHHDDQILFSFRMACWVLSSRSMGWRRIHRHSFTLLWLKR